MKNLKSTSLIILFVLLQSNAYPAIRYVKAGNPTPIPPYTSWATASDSIQKCINVCVPGDTIYVGNGVYKEKLTLIHKLALIGSGWDSCVVDISRFPEPSPGSYPIVAFDVRDSCIVENFTVTGGYTHISWRNSWAGFSNYQWPPPNITKLIVDNCFCYRISEPIILNNFEFKHNIVNWASHGATVSPFPMPGIGIIDSNFMINVVEYAVGNNPTPIVRNNIFHFLTRGKIISLFESNYDAIVMNNVAFVRFHGTDYIFEPDGKYHNNITFIDAPFAFNLERSSSSVKNNIIINAKNGVTISGSASPDSIRYNNFWKVGKRYANFTIPNDTTNLSVDPMFVREQTQWDTLPGDYHLQKFSPLIDKGDPAILDRDGTRSDMGIFGGPLGEIYEYRDYAPKPPQGIRLRYDSELKTVTVWWEKATEADFSGYIVYKDTLSGFIPDSSRMLLNITDTSFTMNVSNYNRVYFKICSVDKQGNISEPGTETGIVLTDAEKERIVSEEYKLYPNYPNPFREKTKIGYYVGKRSYVKIMVYDIKGELVKYIENSEREKGYYEAEFIGGSENKGDFGIATEYVSGIYLYKIMVTDAESGLPVLSEMRKMVKIK
ncbi:MAG: hypothetical protein HUU54_17540 [Ignavibacteriaceae bacterium]|nr:hypothetical protein [Ignavibacteriaceae bacterium]